MFYKLQEIELMVTIIKKGMKKKEIHSLISDKKKRKKGIDLKKYCGKVKLQEGPLMIQRKYRDEWN